MQQSRVRPPPNPPMQPTPLRVNKIGAILAAEGGKNAFSVY
jgi:hypothetical protein